MGRKVKWAGMSDAARKLSLYERDEGTVLLVNGYHQCKAQRDYSSAIDRLVRLHDLHPFSELLDKTMQFWVIAELRELVGTCSLAVRWDAVIRVLELLYEYDHDNRAEYITALLQCCLTGRDLGAYLRNALHIIETESIGALSLEQLGQFRDARLAVLTDSSSCSIENIQYLELYQSVVKHQEELGEYGILTDAEHATYQEKRRIQQLWLAQQIQVFQSHLEDPEYTYQQLQDERKTLQEQLELATRLNYDDASSEYRLPTELPLRIVTERFHDIVHTLIAEMRADKGGVPLLISNTEKADELLAALDRAMQHSVQCHATCDLETTLNYQYESLPSIADRLKYAFFISSGTDEQTFQAFKQALNEHAKGLGDAIEATYNPVPSTKAARACCVAAF